MNTVITIAREFGSGGSEVGRLVASRLGFYYADRAVLALAAKRMKLAEVDLSRREERIKSFWGDVLNVFALGPVEARPALPPLAAVSDQDIFAQESQIMQVLAQKQDCVVIGRGGRYVFQDHPKAVHVLLHAPIDSRVARVMKSQGLRSEEQARRLVDDYDRARTAFRAKMTKEDPYRATDYHLCIDTAGLALEDVAALIITYLKAKGAKS